jgi:hypothetical protein
VGQRVGSGATTATPKTQQTPKFSKSIQTPPVRNTANFLEALGTLSEKHHHADSRYIAAFEMVHGTHSFNHFIVFRIRMILCLAGMPTKGMSNTQIPESGLRFPPRGARNFQFVDPPRTYVSFL